MRSMFKLLVIAVGMAGLRLERLRLWKSFAVWAISWAGCLALYLAVFEGRILDIDRNAYKALAGVYAVSVWFLYYCGLSTALGTRMHHSLIERLGENRADTLFNLVLGVIFLNQMLCQTAVMKVYGNTFFEAFPLWSTYALGGVLFCIGILCKTWSTWITGLDTYYYRDMFLGRIVPSDRSDPFVASGPYKALHNPMYGVGNLAAYGGAIWYRSWQGLIIAAAFQASIYIFYFLFERPFVRRTYRAHFDRTVTQATS